MTTTRAGISGSVVCSLTNQKKNEQDHSIRHPWSRHVCGLSATHSSAVLFHNVGFSHSKAVTNYAAETGVEPLLVPAYAPCVGQVRGVFVVIKCHVCVHGSMHEHFASRTPVFRKSCFDQW